MKAMDVVIGRARDNLVLPMRSAELLEGDDFGEVPILNGNSYVNGGGRYRVRLDDFIARLSRQLPDLVPANSFPISVNYFSTGRYDGYARRLKRVIEALYEFDGSSHVGDSLSTETNYRNLFIAGSQVLMSSMSTGDVVKAFKDVIDNLLWRWKIRSIPVRVGLRRSLMMVSECDEGDGAGLCIGRRHLLKKDEIESISGGLVPTISALNFVAAETDTWYRIPAVPYGVTPGVRGFEIQVGAAEMIDHEHIARMRSVMETAVVGEGKMKRHVRAPLPSLGEDGRMIHAVCGRHESASPLIHLRFRDEEVEPALLPAAQTMMFVVPVEGGVEVRCSAVASTDDCASLDVSVGGAALLMPVQTGVVQTFTISPLASPSSALIIKPYLFA